MEQIALVIAILCANQTSEKYITGKYGHTYHVNKCFGEKLFCVQRGLLDEKKSINNSRRGIDIASNCMEKDTNIGKID